VLNHSLGVTAKFTDFASGITDEPHARQGDLPGADHHTAARATVEVAKAAWRAADMTRTCRLSFGTFPAQTVAGINLFDALAHTWDIASPLAVELDADDELWRIGLRVARQVIGPARDSAHYGEEIPISRPADPMRLFLAFLGRNPPPATAS
jgi:uncharacterized protein (TIGR03086 family)